MISKKLVNVYIIKGIKLIFKLNKNMKFKLDLGKLSVGDTYIYTYINSHVQLSKKAFFCGAEVLLDDHKLAVHFRTIIL